MNIMTYKLENYYGLILYSGNNAEANLNPYSFQQPCTGGQVCKLVDTNCTLIDCLAQEPKCVNPTCDVSYHLCYRFRRGN